MLVYLRPGFCEKGSYICRLHFATPDIPSKNLHTITVYAFFKCAGNNTDQNESQ